MKVAGALLATVALSAWAAACSEPERLPQPFASLIPSCEQTRIAPSASFENVHEVDRGELGLSYELYERGCEGDEVEMVMAMRHFPTEVDAHTYATTLVEADPDVGFFVYDMKDYASPDYAVEDFEAFGSHETGPILREFGFEEGEGLVNVVLQFRRGRYVGTYLTGQHGEIAYDELGLPFFVLAETRPDILERLMNETLRRWDEMGSLPP